MAAAFRSTELGSEGSAGSEGADLDTLVAADAAAPAVDLALSASVGIAFFTSAGGAGPAGSCGASGNLKPESGFCRPDPADLALSARVGRTFFTSDALGRSGSLGGSGSLVLDVKALKGLAGAAGGAGAAFCVSLTAADAADLALSARVGSAVFTSDALGGSGSLGLAVKALKGLAGTAGGAGAAFCVTLTAADAADLTLSARLGYLLLISGVPVTSVFFTSEVTAEAADLALSARVGSAVFTSDALGGSGSLGLAVKALKGLAGAAGGAGAAFCVSLTAADAADLTLSARLGYLLLISGVPVTSVFFTSEATVEAADLALSAKVGSACFTGSGPAGGDTSGGPPSGPIFAFSASELKGLSTAGLAASDVLGASGSVLAFLDLITLTPAGHGCASDAQAVGCQPLSQTRPLVRSMVDW